MKKILSLLLIMLLVFTASGNALAYDDEITFQGIPWYQSFPEVVKYLAENELVEDNQIHDQLEILPYCYGVWVLDSKSDIDVLFYDAKVVNIFGTDSVKMNRSIGGYEDLTAYMRYVLNEEEWKLFSVKFYLDVPNKEEAYADLGNKLASVYGEAQNAVLYGAEVLYWKGANNTCIVLCNPPDSMVQLLYCKLENKEFFDQAVANYPTPSNNVENTTDGL